MTAIAIWYDPPAGELGSNELEFLRILGAPSCLVVPGLDHSRCRFIVTLLHGNEPSGTIAVHRWLTQPRDVPAVDVYCIIMNIEVALAKPYFSLRQRPGRRDLNRCFREPFDDAEGQLAAALLNLIHRYKPESLVDIHNTSGMGPAFGVAVFYDRQHDALVSLFTERLVVTDLRLGALMELSDSEVPTVTVECGGSQDPESHQIAYDGLQRYVSLPQLFVAPDSDWPLDVLHHPVRLELDPALVIAYAEQSTVDADLCMRVDIEHFNFGEVCSDTPLGWVTARGWQGIRVVDSRGDNYRDKYLRHESGQLFPAARLKLFMITSNPTIAKSDCLCYAVRCAG